jgi:recombination protein U
MREFEEQEGISFILISFTAKNEFYYLRFTELQRFWERGQGGGRKSFRYEELNPEFFLPEDPGILVPYLIPLQRDLSQRPDLG